ncbi:MAG: hypothetical protein H6746_14945 [Deltaproteobacteria bacterium]|nr:hypothetical protein [Deltaproteobacteria bacterium]
MDTALILLCILAFAFAVTGLEERLFGERARTVSNSEYLVLGALFGPLVLGVLSNQRMSELEPLVSVINGLLGFVVGLSLRMRSRHRIARADLVFGLLTAFGAASIIAALAGLAVWLYARIEPDVAALVWPYAATLGAGAVAFSAQITRRGIAQARASGPVSRLLPVAADSGRVIAVALFSIVVAARHAAVADGTTLAFGVAGLWASIPTWVGISVAAGLASGGIFHVFVGDQHDDERLFVATVGLVALTSGIAHALEFSPLGLGLIAGATVANLSPAGDRVATAVRRLDGPAAVLLMVLAGAMWRPIPLPFWSVPIGFILLRAVVLRSTCDSLLRLHGELSVQHLGVGRGLLGQSALAAAIAVNLTLIDDSLLADTAATALLASAVANDLWAGPLLRRMLRDVGETGRQGPAAAAAAAEGARA